ncbi:hypothetical protein C4D60_Mb06t23640 [Musa balbisiana]|uniref:Uncharacterized protein n=1 Tax=Musa balbisiana TaxID=52838 RepID=A0A4S8IRF8_MUSBA|nr:hypothetical protein C4D60_Mb06t23640 [Musa balbisiana]
MDLALLGTISLSNYPNLLPLFPRRAARPLLRSLRSAEDILPTFVGAASCPVSDFNSKGACFYKNTAWMEFHNKSQSRFGGGILHIKTPLVQNLGKSIGTKASNAHRMIGTLQALWHVFPLFTNSGWVESSNLAFLKKHMGATFEGCPQPWISSTNVNDIHSGDFLVISKIRGRWGGFKTLEKLVTGSYVDHSVGNDIIAIPPWDEWWESELKKDESNPHIALLPLHPDMRAKFNNTAAWEYAKCMLHKPYVYHNMIFSWIDTVSGNYLPPLDACGGFCDDVWTRLQPSYAANLWNETLNKRLGTQGLDLPDIIVEAEKRGTSFDKLLTIPDLDHWVYTDGKSTSRQGCSIQLPAPHKSPVYHERCLPTPSNFFESNISRLPEWCDKDDDCETPFLYRMELPGYNSMQPYPHIMNEKCPTLPPNYVRTKYC